MMFLKTGIKKILPLTAFMATFVSSIHAYSEKSATPYLSMEVGFARLDFNGLYTSDDNDSDWGYAQQLVGGIKFSNNIIIAANLAYFEEHDYVFDDDDIELKEIGMLVGYSFDIAEHFRIIPMVGVSFWDLNIEEYGWFTETRHTEDSGNDLYGKLKLQFPITDLFSLSAIYSNGQYDFGKVESHRLGIQFDF